MSLGEFADFLDASLHVLRRETPPAYRRVAERLAGRAVHFEVSEATFALRVAPDGHELTAAADGSLALGLDRSVVLELVEARASLPEAVLGERLRPRGLPEELGRFFDALVAYLEGAVRAPSMPRLYRAYARGELIPADLEEGR